MSIPAYKVRDSYTGAGNLAIYTFDFLIQSLNQLLVIEMDPTGLIQLQSVRGTDTSVFVSGVVFDPINGGGTVTLLANLASGNTLLFLLANDAPTQPNSFKNKFDFTLSLFEQALDYITGPICRAIYLVTRSVKLHDADDPTVFNPTLPPGMHTALSQVPVTAADGSGFAPVSTWPTLTNLANAFAAVATTAASAAAAAVSATASAASATAAALSATAAAASAASSSSAGASAAAAAASQVLAAASQAAAAVSAAAALVSQNAAATSATASATSATASAASAASILGAVTASAASATAAAASATAAAASAASVAAPNLQSTTKAGPYGVTLALGIPFLGTAYENVEWIQGNGGAIDLTSAAGLQIQAGSKVGQKLALIGTSDTNTVRIVDGNGFELKDGKTEIWFFNKSKSTFVYDGSVWSEV
jgi:hypothetical protein